MISPQRASTRSIAAINTAGQENAIRRKTSTRRIILAITSKSPARINPLIHFLHFGQAEGRSGFADGHSGEDREPEAIVSRDRFWLDGEHGARIRTDVPQKAASPERCNQSACAPTENCPACTSCGFFWNFSPRCLPAAHKLSVLDSFGF
jgi:hydroxyacyl-ACP dehydratase HTD2-like protein with hotdog domain